MRPLCLGKIPTILALAATLLRADTKTQTEPGASTINWKGVLTQSGLFLAVEHGFRFSTEPATRRELRGKFFKEYGDAIRGLNGWGDSDPALVNYVGHPMMGAVTGHIFTQNDSDGRRREFSNNSGYWKSRIKAMGWSAVYSTQFELGPLSEAALGNLGSRAVPGTMGYVDLIVTPTAGLTVQVTEDLLDRFVVKKLERIAPWPPLVVASRGVLNPARSMANILRFKVPWHRDTRPGWRELQMR